VRPVIDHILRELDRMRCQQEEEENMTLNKEKEDDIHDDPNVTENADGSGNDEAAGVNEVQP